MENEKEGKDQVCEKHFQSLVVYCSEDSCEDLACSSCVVAKHKEHIDKIIDIPDKAEEIKEELRELKRKCVNSEKHFAGKAEHKQNLIKEINDTSSQTFNEINKACDKIIIDVNEARENLKRKVLLHQNEQLNLFTAEHSEYI